ncbi:single-stranded-DNA-specific exonuclease RecJ [Candidatus Kaiserbacteria bacterium GWA2_50_9]|uniref:Single-stranded-DNA-specific exonuclease RecJ n=1 Tax=Candidatus Kaiserbacteria bacterium GWA2_50_9 TaxID=1798474 RepID=A0A1F6BVZ3_9BACT|nr:MAG: single-stranded-DNA-specific exonuclease RecJ [Candidatus Kaiserbacteria bacterium GWA2_50_9]
MQKYVVRERKKENLVEHLLFHRSITNAEDIEKFLNPDYEKHMHDPFLMKDMEKAVARILRAIQNNERIAIFSDYDADGIPGAVVLHDFFKKIGYANFENYIPDRHGEGFGLNNGAIEELVSRGATLLITIDCGITDSGEVTCANELGMEVIITDHHLLNHSIPQAYAILNPKQPDCVYPEKMLCGSGVVFKLVQALVSRLKITTFPIGWEKWLLDMVGLATLSDMVPLTGENRVFAHFGLRVLRKSPRVGLGQLLRELRINRSDITEDDIGFMVSPRINAASRMGVPMDAFRLFATEDAAEAGALARHLNKINDERKGKVAALVKEVRKIVAERHEERAPHVIVAGSPLWRPSLLGLAANALVEDYQKPVFLWGREGNDTLKGSCRSDGSVDLSLLMHEARAAFLDSGGHAEAGGFSVALEKVHLLESEIERAYEKVRLSREAEPQYTVDARMSIDEVSWDVWNSIAKLAPFGVGNPKPLFLFEQLVVSSVEPFGKERQHLKLVFQKSTGERVSAVQFFTKTEDYGGIAPGKEINLLAHLEKSVFGSYPELRLRIVDVIC